MRHWKKQVLTIFVGGGNCHTNNHRQLNPSHSEDSVADTGIIKRASDGKSDIRDVNVLSWMCLLTVGSSVTVFCHACFIRAWGRKDSAIVAKSLGYISSYSFCLTNSTTYRLLLLQSWMLYLVATITAVVLSVSYISVTAELFKRYHSAWSTKRMLLCPEHVLTNFMNRGVYMLRS